MLGPGLNEVVFLSDTDYIDWAVAIGCCVGGLAAFGMDTIADYIFKKIMAPRAEKWLFESKDNNRT